MPLASSTATRSTNTAVLGMPGTAFFAAAASGLLWLTALLFASRRLAGALVQPLSLPVLVGLALGLVALAVLLRTWENRRSLKAGTSLALVLWALAVSLPGTSLLGLIVFWTVLGLEEAWAWGLLRRARAAGGARSARPTLRTCPAELQACHSERSEESSPAAVAEILRSAQDDTSDEAGFDEELLSDDVLQQLTRRRLPDGSEQLTGWLRVPLEAGQRTANVHLAFCPPFAQTPQVLVEQHEGLPARIKLAQSLPFGARFDLKLAQVADEPSTLVLHVQAIAKP